jgi:nucleotide-binding universal stress UspA family protein
VSVTIEHQPPTRPAQPREWGGRPRRSILCAVDALALETGLLLPTAVALARDRDARLQLLAVVARSDYWFVRRGARKLGRAAEERARRWGAEALARVPADLDAAVLLRSGAPAAAIISEARGGGHEMVVLGRRPRPRRWRRRSSVSARVVAVLDVPVVVVPTPTLARSIH